MWEGGCAGPFEDASELQSGQRGGEGRPDRLRKGPEAGSGAGQRAGPPAGAAVKPPWQSASGSGLQGDATLLAAVWRVD